MTDERPRRISESGRVEAFSDGVFSIAITLLVLELAIPTIKGGFAKELADGWVSYLAYLAAFGSIGVLWMGHHTAFSRIRAVDAGLLAGFPSELDLAVLDIKDGVCRVTLREYLLVLPVVGNRPSVADLGQKDMGIERQFCFRYHRRPLSEARVRQERIIFGIPVFRYWEETRGQTDMPPLTRPDPMLGWAAKGG